MVMVIKVIMVIMIKMTMMGMRMEVRGGVLITCNKLLVDGETNGCADERV